MVTTSVRSDLENRVAVELPFDEDKQGTAAEGAKGRGNGRRERLRNVGDDE